MTLTRQYLEATRQMQENWFSAVDAMTAQFSQKLDRPATNVFPAADPRKAVDELFDFYSKALSVQRETAHKILDANMQVSDQWNAQVEQFYSAWREQAQSMTDTARAQLESLTASSREQALQFGEAMEARMSEAQHATREQAQRFMTAAQEQGERFMSAA
ncbi:MAG: hypothetical protein Q4G43_03950, partial [Mobilicoccus sp.]|nr:hypothetical protein [Mobilicoccus sp.]